MVRKYREKKKIDRKQAGERTKEKENRGERQEKGRKLNEIKRKEDRMLKGLWISRGERWTQGQDRGKERWGH